MRIQRVRDGELDQTEALDVPMGTEVFVTTRMGTLKLVEDEFSGVLYVSHIRGGIVVTDE
ncbi:hypothetical protein HYP71_gp056 [Arthrobacter phage KBurrousTX]|uniref:Uncharacterized protein n=1 Tax=Arthrobacter phage KBurrousTX TaxID=2315608 RepID=A0A386KBD7_9CAUD|nr:hypothetical protein HYP71_gp056 [Arthrobacter phage KBurrousTX]AYD81550.1 hypothetical protein KBurrousTX_56 [Arthrobacter phage KBurrousTX]